MELAEDADLARQLIEDDEECLNDILRAFGGGVLALLRRQFRGVLREEDFEDVLSMGLFRLWNHRQRYLLERASLRVYRKRAMERVRRALIARGHGPPQKPE